MAAVSTFHSGKAVVQIAAFPVAGNDFLKVGPPEPVPPFKSLLVDLNKGLQMIFHAPVIIGGLGIPGAVDAGRGRYHGKSVEC